MPWWQIADLEIAGRIGDKAALRIVSGNHDRNLPKTGGIALSHAVECVIVEDVAHQP